MQLPFLFIYTGWRASSGSQASPIAPRPVRRAVNTAAAVKILGGQQQSCHELRSTMEAILRDENLEHLLPSLARRDVRELQSLLAANRVAFLAELKALGVAKVGERQKLANAFNRVEQSGTANASRSFDLTCALKDGGATQFVNLARSEYKKLYDYLVTRKIRIKNIAKAAGSSSYAEDGGDDDDDPYMNQIKHQRAQEEAMDDDDDDDDEDEDEDFAPGAESDVDEEYDEGDEADEDKMGGKKGKGGGSDDDSDDSDAPAAGGGGGGSDDSDDEEAKPLAKKPKVAAGKAPAKPKPPPKEPKGKKGKKKDPNAPKRGLSAFMFFSNAMRETIKAENPEASFGELGKIAGQKWKEMDDASKEPYLTKASEDKARYEREKAEHKAATGASAAADDDSDSD